MATGTPALPTGSSRARSDALPSGPTAGAWRDPSRKVTTVRRCEWARGRLEVLYHDREWGVPLHNDRKLFELLILEGAQAGLSWSTILRRRPAYRRAFDRFDPRKIARYSAKKVRHLLADSGIIRNRAKIEATIANAQAFQALRRAHGSFDAYLWRFVGGRPLQNRRRPSRQVPAETELSRALSRDLKMRGFRFVGPTICYAFMQAAGLVNDHTANCFRWRQVQRLGVGGLAGGPRARRPAASRAG